MSGDPWVAVAAIADGLLIGRLYFEARVWRAPVRFARMIEHLPEDVEFTWTTADGTVWSVRKQSPREGQK